MKDATPSLRENGGESRNRSVFILGRPGLVISIRSCNGDKKKASKLTGISLATIYRKLGTDPSAEK